MLRGTKVLLFFFPATPFFFSLYYYCLFFSVSIFILHYCYIFVTFFVANLLKNKINKNKITFKIVNTQTVI